MQFVLLYGRPAVGKLTVARELAKLTSYRLFDNHLIVDATLAVYDFGTPQFIALREALWRAAFQEIAKDQALPGLIFTFNPENSVPQRFVDDLFQVFADAGVATRCFELVAPEAVIEARLAAADRREKHKLVDLDLYRQLRATGTFDTPVITHNRLVIDTSTISPASAARQIADALAQR
ncbi:MAG TPA: AAA family ATPase [Candidatus Synoicihabitans sp.]|nr:AAA family ATPase [Candidatus Synoicihabitans sp.]